VQDGVNVSDADIVIENGLDYDSWMDKLIGAAPNPDRTVITAGKIATDLIPENPHIWYGVDNMPVIAGAIHDALKKADPADGADFDNNLAAFDASIVALLQKMADIKSKFNGTPAALTETIFLYQARPLGLNVLTPPDFQMAISEGNDPSARDVQTANDQLLNKKVMVLIFNGQTVTPVTTNLQNEAKQLNIPLVTVTETMPKGQNYQGWMTGQLDDLRQILYNGEAG
jgi:zinc/manganese transport system substrate-binding protein